MFSPVNMPIVFGAAERATFIGVEPVAFHFIHDNDGLCTSNAAGNPGRAPAQLSVRPQPSSGEFVLKD